MKSIILPTALLLLVSVALIGCGETVRGAWKDMQRVGGGVKTIFVAE